ncbi:MAG: glycosyltransferase family 9 protein [Deltaproteobacteria bacterium]|nr:glycosyltransferase family 9 protein [Deltaproteobacteria bacterium]
MLKSSIKSIPPYPSILIILMGSLGDVARGLCLVSLLKVNLPQSRVTWLVEPKWSELVSLNRQIDRMIIFKRAWRLSAVWQLYKDLRQDHFDIVLDLQRILKSGLFSLLSGAKRRIGFHHRNAKEFNWIFNNEHIGYYNDDLPKIRHYLKFTEYLGLPEPASLEFGLSSLSVKESAPGVIAAMKQPFIAVVLGTSWESKNWYVEGYLDLIRQILSGYNLKIVLLGDQTQRAPATKLIQKINSPDLLNLVGKTTLVELTALLKAAVAGVGPDSGPGHLAAAVNTPFVTLFGPTSPQRTAPFGYEQLVVEAGPGCAPCYKNRCPDRNRQCMYSIHPDAVMAKVSMALTEYVHLR